MYSNNRCQLRNAFALPKVAVTKTPSLNPVMAAQFEHKDQRQGFGPSSGANARHSWSPHPHTGETQLGQV